MFNAMLNEKRQMTNQEFGNKSYRFHDKVFACVGECIDTLLHEAKEIITQINKGNYENNRLNRNFATWRLDDIEKYMVDYNLKEYRNECNNLWSQLYRLEHSSADHPPYVKKVRQIIMTF